MKPSRGKTPKKTPRKPPSSVKDPVEVYARLRPVDREDEDVCIEVVNSNTMQLRPPEGSHAYRNGNYKETQHGFKFIFTEDCSQKAIFDHVALPLVEDLLHGKNALLFMYGVTGSGKTHTMQGTPTDGGVLTRSLDVLFNSLGDLQARKYVFKPDRVNGMDVQTEADAMLERQKKELMPPPVAPRTPRTTMATSKTPTTPRRTRKDPQDLVNIARVPDTTRLSSIDEDNNYAVFVSYIEIYNNLIYDLLEDLPVSLHMRNLTSRNLREDSNHNMYVAMSTEVEVKTPEEAYAAFLKGQNRRKVAHTQLNTESSRSHSVFNIRLVQAPLDSLGQEVIQDKNQICISQLALVDLAGSERHNRTNSTGDRLKEAGNINASLMTLRTCIETLRENQTEGANKLVPYRTSKLTHLFKNYFDGEGKVRMVVCVNPSAKDYDETIHVMRFAEITQEVQVARPTEVRFDIGLTPGRRKANEVYKKLLAENGDENMPLPPPPFLTLGPPFPLLQLTDPADNTTLPTLLAFLCEREKRRRTMEEELTRKQGAFRAMLIETDNELEQLRAANAELQSKLQSKTREADRFEKRVRSLEQDNLILQRSHRAYEKDKRYMESELSEKEKKIQMEEQERVRLKQALKGAVSSQRDKWEKECAKRVRQTELKMQTEMWVREEKLRQLKQIVEAHEEEESSKKAAKEVLAESMNRSRSPPTVKHSQAPLRLKHRRSRSTSNNVWIDHQPVETLDTETVLQPPKTKNRKRVSAPSVKDIQKTDNYMLTHQEEDSQGEIETKIYKAEVLPTRSGGRAVQFTDVEKLTSEDPLSPTKTRTKRRAEDDPAQYSGEWTDVETRCAVGIEHKAGQSMTSAVHTVANKKLKK